jgi:hypothetical protein
VLAFALLLAIAQPRLGVVDATPAGAPDLTAAVAAAAGKLGRFDVEPADAVDSAVNEARRVGAACGFDDGPECWARLGVLSDLDRIVVVRKSAASVDLLLVDVPARTAARSSTPSTETDPAKLADIALAALLSGQAVKVANPAKEAPKEKGAAFYAGAYSAAFAGVVFVGCGGGAVGVSSQMATLLVGARDQKIPLGDSYRGLNTAFIALSACTGVAAVAGIGGGITALVVE